MTIGQKYKKLWIVLGVIAILLILAFAHRLSLKKNQNAVLKTPDQAIGLGELGAECGGEKRLPCKPGLNCVLTSPQSKQGICQKLIDVEPGKTEPIK